jgi:hypothetical protein
MKSINIHTESDLHLHKKYDTATQYVLDAIIGIIGEYIYI